MADPKSNKLKARLPRGLEDRAPAEIAATRRMMETIRKVYELYGFEPVETPAIEYTDALGKFLPDQDRPNEGVFSFQDDDEQWLSLRYDLTAPLARYVAENFDTLPKPYRSYRAGYVYRNEKPGPGRFRQFMQFDADTVGSASMAADAEICMMAADTMEALGIPRGSYVVKVNNRKVLDGVLELTDLGGDAHAGKRLTVLRTIDKLDRLGDAGVRALLGDGRRDESGDFTKGAGLTQAQIEWVLGLLETKPESDDSIASAELRLRNSKTGNDGIAELRQISDLVAKAGYADDRIRIDTSVVRGLEYYTGPVFEVELTFSTDSAYGSPRFGSVGGGGRYDGLVSRFRGAPVPATGFSIGVSRLLAALTHLGKIDAKPEPGPVIVTVLDRDRLADYQRMAATLRAAGIRAELYLGTGKFSPQMKYANRRGSPCVVIQGTDEKQKGEVQIKDLIVGAELAGLSKERDDYLKKQAEAQFAVPEHRLVEAVREVLARHGVTWGNPVAASSASKPGNNTIMTLEQFISKLNSLAFFKEFTFSRNTFKPAAGGTELELADNIVWMGDDLTILQLKERSTNDVKDDASETRWFQDKVLGNGTKQVRDTLKFLETNRAINVTNERGHSFDIRGDELRTKTKIVVYLPGNIVPEIAKTTRHYVSKTGGFIHVLDARDYLEICRTLRVPADIRDYFAYRQRLLESNATLAAAEPLIMGQYLSGDEKPPPSRDSYRYLLALKQSDSDFDLSRLLANLHRQIEHESNPYAYYEILRQFARLPRSGWKEAKTRLAYCIEAVQAQEFRPPTRFAWKNLSLGFVFIPVDPKLMAEENAAELMGRGLTNFTMAHKYEQKLDCCVGLVVAKDQQDFLLNWSVMKHPWEHDPELDAKWKEGSPFLQVNEKVIPRFEFE